MKQTISVRVTGWFFLLMLLGTVGSSAAWAGAVGERRGERIDPAAPVEMVVPLGHNAALFFDRVRCSL